MSTATIPITVTEDAADFIAKKKLQEPYQRMLDNIPTRFPGVQGINVTLEPPYDVGDGPRVILDVHCSELDADGTAQDNWIRWIIEAFPPQHLEHFCLLSSYGPSHGRQTVS